MTERFYVPTIKYFLGEPVRVIEVNNVEYLICKDMFSVLGRVRADGSWDDAKKKLFNFTKPSRTIQDPENFGALVEQGKIQTRQEVLCIRLEDAPIIASQYRPPQTKPLVLQKWYDFIDWLNILIKENSESVYVRAKIIEYINALEEVLRGAKKIDIPNYRFSRVPGYREQVYELCYNKSKSNKKEDSPPLPLLLYILLFVSLFIYMSS